MERLPRLCKELRQEVHAIKLKKLMALDRSDRVLLEQHIEAIINDLLYIQTVGDAKCSVVVEMFEHMGGKIRTCRTVRKDTNHGAEKTHSLVAASVEVSLS